jgi:hypothetical protein
MSTVTGLEKSIRADEVINRQVINPKFRSPVFVIFTSPDQTLKALEKADQVARLLRTRIEILALQSVPYTLPLDESSVPFEFLVRHLEEMAGQFPEPTKISAYLCRDPMETLKKVLNRYGPVVIGIRKRWWPTCDERLARKLCHAGYHVILVNVD